MELIDKVLERWYAVPIPNRPRTRPLQVICVGPSRSGTDSLRQALLILGYPKVHHGFETIPHENRHHKPLLTRFLERKYGNSSKTGESDFTAEEFDVLFGEYDALTDMPAAAFAPELVAAYPGAKVVLNRRADVDAWYDSVLATFISFEESWVNWFQSFFSPDLYWTQRVIVRGFMRWFYRGSFRANGKWIYREHCAVVRGLVPGERLLEWGVEDGWEPLCKFLGKEVPEVEFPRGNATPEFNRVIYELHRGHRRDAYRNMMFCGSLVVGVVAAVVMIGRPGGLDLRSLLPWKR